MSRRGRGALRVAATLLLVAAALLARSATSPSGGRSEVRRALPAPSPTPLLSVRRVPWLLVEGAGAQRLQAGLASLLAPLGGGACAVVSDSHGLIAAHRPEASLAPASTQKLLTAAAALSELGADSRLVTRVSAVAPLQGGTLTGDLYMVGGGDPILSTPGYVAYLRSQPRTRTDPVTPLSGLVDAILAAGVTHIDGAVLGDDSRHDPTRYLPDWKPSYRSEGQIGPLGALEVDDGFTSWGGRVGAEDPAAFAAAQLTALLEDSGVPVAGGAGSATAPAGAREIASITSPPLSEVVAGMLTSSDNLTAEILAREVGVAAAREGSSEAGTDAIVAEIASLGVPTAGVDLADGSGLAPSNRATCNALLSAVRLGDAAPFTALSDGLADAGESGTLALRFVGDPLRGHLHAKTGQIDGVVGLAGRIDGGRDLHFAFLANGDFSMAQGWAFQERVADLVGAYPDAPPAPDLVPLPGAE